MINLVRTQSYLHSPNLSLSTEGEDWIIGFDNKDDLTNFNLMEPSNNPIILIEEIGKDSLKIAIECNNLFGTSPEIDLNDENLIISGVRASDGNNGVSELKNQGINMVGFRRTINVGNRAEILSENYVNGILELLIKNNTPEMRDIP